MDDQPEDAPPPDRGDMLEAELHLMKTAGIIEVAVRNPSVSEYMAHWEARAERAEAKLALAVEGLNHYAGITGGQVARDTLAKIGEADD